MNEQAIRQAERSRIKTIMESPEAKGREEAALKMALSTDMEHTQIVQILASLPKHELRKGATPFETIMAKMGNPDIEPDAEDESGLSEDDRMDRWARRVAGRK